MKTKSEIKYYVITNPNDYIVFNSHREAETHISENLYDFTPSGVDSLHALMEFFYNNIECVCFDELTPEQKDYLCGDRI